MTDSALAPCPFCGGQPEHYFVTGEAFHWRVTCPTCRFHIGRRATSGVSATDPAKQEVTAAWNRRSSPGTGEAEREELAKFVGWLADLPEIKHYRDKLDCIAHPLRATPQPAGPAPGWRTEQPEPDARPGRQFVHAIGYAEHSGVRWRRDWTDIACTDNTGPHGYRQADIDRICRDGDMDAVERIAHWMPISLPPLPAAPEPPAPKEGV